MYSFWVRAASMLMEYSGGVERDGAKEWEGGQEEERAVVMYSSRSRCWRGSCRKGRDLENWKEKEWLLLAIEISA